MAWVQRMLTPKNEGPFEAWSALAPTLMPLLKEEVAGLFLPWSTANAAAIAAGQKSFEMTLGGAAWSQEPQKYHARSLAELRRKYAAAKGAPGLDAILAESGCLRHSLRISRRARHEPAAGSGYQRRDDQGQA